jgi:hypothetical protein
MGRFNQTPPGRQAADLPRAWGQAARIGDPLAEFLLLDGLGGRMAAELDKKRVKHSFTA